MTCLPEERHDLTPGMNDQHILLIDDHAVFRLGLRMLLCEAFSAARVSEAASLEQAIEHTPQAPDLVLLDIKLPGLNGIEGTALLKARWPHTRVIILSSLDAPEAIDEALGYGTAGYLSKGESAERLREAHASGIPLLHKPVPPHDLRHALLDLLAVEPPMRNRPILNWSF